MVKGWSLLRNATLTMSLGKKAKSAVKEEPPPAAAAAEPPPAAAAPKPTTQPDPKIDATPAAGRGEFVVNFASGKLGLSIDHDSRRHDLPRIVRATANSEMRPGDQIIKINSTSLEAEKGDRQDLARRMLSSGQRPLEMTLRSGNAVDIVRNGRATDKLPGKFSIDGGEFAEAMDADGSYLLQTGSNLMRYVDDRLGTRDFVVTFRLKLEGDVDGFGIHFDDSFFAWDDENERGYVQGEYFATNSKRINISRSKSFDFDNIFEISIQKHKNHFTFLFNTSTIGTFRLSMSSSSTLFTSSSSSSLTSKGSQGSGEDGKSLERLALKQFGGRYRLYSWCLWAEDYGRLAPLPSDPPPPSLPVPAADDASNANLPDGHYNVVSSGHQMGLKFREDPTTQNLFVKSNSGVLGPLPEVNDVVVSVDGTHVHSHDKMDACKFAPSFHTVVTALPLSALRPP